MHEAAGCPALRAEAESARRTAAVALVDGAPHITFLTEDMDRLLAFYVRVFDAEVTVDMTEEGLRHTFIKVGPTTV